MAACFLLPFFSYKHRISVGDSRACRTCFPSTCQTLVETRQQTPPRPWPQQRRETGAAAAANVQHARRHGGRCGGAGGVPGGCRAGTGARAWQGGRGGQ